MMTDKLFEQLLLNPESWTIDFKVKSYDFVANKEKENGSFIKDVLAFSNTIRKDTAYIIAGIQFVGGNKNLVGITDMLDDASFQEKAGSKLFPHPRFLAYLHVYKGETFGIIEFPVHPHTEPIRCRADVKSVEIDKVYLRRGSSNQEANYEEIKAIEKWLKALQLSDAPMPDAPVNEKHAGYIKRTVTSAEGDSIAQFMFDHDTLEQALEKNPRIALLGWGLSGKSTELKQLAFNWSRRAEARVYRINLDNHLKGSISKRIPDIDRIIDQDKVVVLLDGLDEILPKYFDQARRKISRFVEKYPAVKLVVSCRTNFYTTDKEDKTDSTLTGFSSYWLDNLDRDEVEKYLNDYLKSDKTNFIHEIDKKDIRELLVTPYYLTKLVAQFKKTRKIPGSKADIFKLEINEQIKKDIVHYRGKERDTLATEVFRLLSKVAFVMETRGTNQITSAELNKILPEKGAFKKIRKIASLFQGTDGNSRTWKFNHNNTQEYLAASTLVGLSIQSIKKIVGIGPAFNKVKPSWVNTLSFLNSILKDDSPLKSEITHWLVTDNRDLVIAMEPDKIDDATKLEIFKSIFLKFKSDGRRINRNLYRLEDLAKFSESPKVFDFLLDQLQDEKHPMGISNALEIVNFYSLHKYKVYQEKFKAYYEKFLFGKETLFHIPALAGYAALFPLTKDEFLKIYTVFKDHDDTWIRYQLFIAIWLSKTQNELVQYLVDQAVFLVQEDRPMKNNRGKKTRLTNENLEIATALEMVDEPGALTVFFKGAKKHFHALAYSTYFKKVFPGALRHAAKHPGDKALLRAISQVFTDHHSYILHDLLLQKSFTDYYRTTGHLDELLILLYQKNGTKDFSTGHSLAQLATTNFIDFLSAESALGRLSIQQTENFISMIESAGNPNEGYFRKKVRLPAPAKRPPRNFEKERVDEEARNLVILFDEEMFVQEVIKIFDAYGKMVLTNEDRYSSSGVDFYGSGFAEVARDVLELGPYEPDAVLEEVVVGIRANFENGTINRVYAYLLKHPQAVLTDEQRAIITQWCNDLFPQVDFGQAVMEGLYNDWELQPQAVLLSFFIRYLNLTGYADEFYLSMLSFIRYQDTRIDIIPFVESVIGVDRTSDQIQANLRDGVSNRKLLSDYVKYLEANEVTGSTNILLDYLLQWPNEDQYEMLTTYSKLGGDSEALYPVLDQAKSYFRYRIIEILIRAESPEIKNYLRRLLGIETEPDERLAIIRFLVRLQDNKALALYLKHVAEIGRSPDDSSPGNPLYSLRKLRYTKQMIDLYELAQAPGFHADSFSDLRSIASTALQNIALFPSNFEKFTKLIGEWIKERIGAAKESRQPAPEQVIRDLHFFLETFGKQHETSSVVMPTLDESLKIYSKVLRKQQKKNQ